MLTALGVLLLLVGLVGLLLPAIPGTPLVFLGSLLVAWADGFTRVGWLPLTVMAALAVFSMVADAVAGLVGARKAGASRWGVIGSVVGLLAGLPFGLVGIVLGPAVGAVAFEYFRDPDAKRAATAGVGVFIGFVIGTAVKYACAFAMLGILVASYLW